MYLSFQVTLKDYLIERSWKFYRWDLLTIHYHPDGFGNHRNCDSGDIMFLICHLTSRNHMFKGLCEFMGWSSSQLVTTLPCFVAISLLQVEKKYFMFHLTLQNHVTDKTMWLKHNIALWVGARYCISPPCQVFWV